MPSELAEEALEEVVRRVKDDLAKATSERRDEKSNAQARHSRLPGGTLAPRDARVKLSSEETATIKSLEELTYLLS